VTGLAAIAPWSRSFTAVTLEPGAMSDTHLTLYRLQACPFCERVVRKLNDLGLEYDSRFVEARHSRRDVVKRVAGVRTVPVLVDERTGVTMAESGNIVEYLEGTYGAGTSAEERAAARADGGDA
jgi:glutathione S-transferase